ncbi:MAG: copper amine oxidase N-terminal domain-containing protein [Firmicutes bacterium]|nr:copper amine oxidase N-terminal domain-containing protein [Bacillota bacterium]
MKKKMFSTAAITLAMLFPLTAYADNDVKVTLNNAPISFETAQPTIVNGRTLVPLRGVFDKMGYEISYDNVTKTATLKKDQSIIKASSAGLILNDKSLEGDVLPQLINDSFMIPLRAVSEASSASIDWNAATKTVNINLPLPENNSEEIPDTYISADPRGTMPVDEEQYINTLNNAVTSIKSTAVSKRCTPVLLILGLVDEEDVILADSYSEADLKWLDDNIDSILAMSPPKSLDAVQKDVNDYATILLKASLYCKDNNMNRADLKEKLNALGKERAELNANFSVDLYNYFTDNNVFFESVYGEEILDMLS